MTNNADDMPSWRHVEESTRLLNNADQHPSAYWPEMTGETKTDILLAALTHAVLALVKVTGRTP